MIMLRDALIETRNLIRHFGFFSGVNYGLLRLFQTRYYILLTHSRFYCIAKPILRLLDANVTYFLRPLRYKKRIKSLMPVTASCLLEILRIFTPCPIVKRRENIL